MLTIMLHGTNTATCGYETVTTAAKKGPIGPLCRKLIDAGHSPDESVTVWRGNTPVFALSSLGRWADQDTVESDTGGIKSKPYVEFVPFA